LPDPFTISGILDNPSTAHILFLQLFTMRLRPFNPLLLAGAPYRNLLRDDRKIDLGPMIGVVQ